MSLTPALFHSTKTSGSDTGNLRPVDWNNLVELVERILAGADTHGSVAYRSTSSANGLTYAPSAAGVLACAGAGQAPSFRALVASDIPALDYVSSTTARSANTVLAGPVSGADAAPGFRALVAADLPSGLANIVVAGPSAQRTFTLPDADATILTTNAAVTAAQGGTGQSSYTTGDLVYASASNALSKLAAVAAGSVLVSGGVGAAPAWSASPSLTGVTLADGLVGTPSLAGTNYPTTGLYWASGPVLNVSVNGTKAAQFGYDNINGVTAIGLQPDPVITGGTMSLIGSHSNEFIGFGHFPFGAACLFRNTSNELEFYSYDGTRYHPVLTLIGTSDKSIIQVQKPDDTRSLTAYYPTTGNPRVTVTVPVGTNNAGTDLEIGAGPSTGSATPGEISLMTATAGSSGTTENSLVERVRIRAGTSGVVFGDNIPLRMGGNVAGAGIIRLQNNAAVNWRNAANNNNVGLSIDGSDRLVSDAVKTIIGSAATNPMMLYGGTSASFPAIKRDTVFLQLRLADDSGVSGAATASLPAAASARDGIVGFDTTLNALVYYVGGNRYKLVGTSF